MPEARWWYVLSEAELDRALDNRHAASIVGRLLNCLRMDHARIERRWYDPPGWLLSGVCLPVLDRWNTEEYLLIAGLTKRPLVEPPSRSDDVLWGWIAPRIPGEPAEV